MNNITGYIHSIESLGGVDGPGVRAVVFMQGCPLRCAYCHNPDTWNFSGGESTTNKELFDRILRFKPYFGKNGGVTLSGGEPLAQATFAAGFFKLCKEAGISTALDTAGSYMNDDVIDVLNYTDLVILDVKHTDPEEFIKLTGGNYSNFNKFFEYCTSINKPIWLRQVIVPGITDNDENLRALTELAKKSNALKVELLAYHDMGRHKWEKLGLSYSLDGITPPSEEKMKKLRDDLNNLLDLL